jgi:hypothetical protein
VQRPFFAISTKRPDGAVPLEPCFPPSAPALGGVARSRHRPLGRAPRPERPEQHRTRVAPCSSRHAFPPLTALAVCGGRRSKASQAHFVLMEILWVLADDTAMQGTETSHFCHPQPRPLDYQVCVYPAPCSNYELRDTR